MGYTSDALKVVLVNPPSPPEFRVSRGLMGGFGMAVNPELLYPPIELAHVAGALLEDGHDVAIIDGDALGVDLDGALARVKAEAPALVVLDSSSTSLDQDLELAGRVREATGALTGMLGSQVTFTPDEIFSGGPDRLRRARRAGAHGPGGRGSCGPGARRSMAPPASRGVPRTVRSCTRRSGRRSPTSTRCRCPPGSS